MEEQLTAIIQTGFVMFLFALLVCAVGLIMLMVIEYGNRKIERESLMAEYEYETDPRTKLRRRKEEEASNDLYFDTIQEFYNGV